MGHGIAVACASAGIRVSLTDNAPRVLDAAAKKIDQTFALLTEARIVTRGQASAARRRIVLAPTLREAVGAADLVQESIQESVKHKRGLFAELDALCSPDTILATNTSSIRIAEIASATVRPERVIGVHWVSPAYLVPVIEVVVGSATSVQARRRVLDYIERMAKTPVVSKDTPGFVINRIQMAMLNEAIRLVESRIATAQDVDAAIRIGLGSRLAIFGPLECNDLFVTKDTTLKLLEYLYTETGEDKFRPSRLLRRMVRANENGMFSGKGFFRYPRPAKAVTARRDRALIAISKFLRTCERGVALPFGRAHVK